MKKPLSEERIRRLIRLCESPLRWVKSELENDELGDSTTYSEAVLALMEIERIKEEIGYEEPEGTTLKQIKLF